MSASPARFPGAELVEEGLAALARHETTVSALLVAIGAPRLRRQGVPVPPDVDLPPDPELALYALLCRSGAGAHGRYNALLRELISYEHALEHANARARRLGSRGQPGG